MLHRPVKQLVVAFVSIVMFSGGATAGDISGVVKHMKGGNASGVRISGLTAGPLGGTTKTVYSDDRGKFVLSWKSSGGLAKLYANGEVVATDIRDGETIVVKLK